MRASLPGYQLVPLLLVALVSAASASAAPSTLEVALSESAAQRAEQVSNAVPVLAHVSDMTVNPGEVADQAITATDGDGNPLTFGKSFGPAFVTVTTTTPGTGSAQGNIHAAPAVSDAGTNQVGITVSDGFATVAQSIEVEVPGGDHAPVLTQPNNMSVPAGNTVTQELTAVDNDGNALSFYVNGPSFATVSTNDPGAGLASGTLRLATLTTQATGAYPITVGVTDGTLTNEKSLTATVLPRLNTAPLLFQPENAQVQGGSAVDVELHAVDAEHDVLSFSLVSGPAFVTVSTVNATAGLGNAHIAPPLTVPSNTYVVTVSVSDGLASDQRSFLVFATGVHPPTLGFISNMSPRAGQTLTQSIFASDPDGGQLTFGKVSGPTYMDVATTSQSSGFSQGRITLTPSTSDIGTATGVVSVTDGTLFDQRSFTITVGQPNHPPFFLTPPADMTVTQGSIGEQVVQAVDADNDFVSFSIGPNSPGYMDVFSTGLIRLTPGANDVGTAQGAVRATDNFGGVANATFQITVLAGTLPPACPAGSFNVTSTPGAPSYSVRAADLNGDDVQDVVAADYDGGNTDIYFGDGAGGLAAPVHYPSFHPIDAAIGDFNGDLIPDLASLEYSPSSVSVRLGLGPGTFGPLQSFLIGESPTRLLTADFDRDGHLDLVASTYSYTATLSFLYGSGTGGFEPARNLALNDYCVDIQVVDVNHDGWPDILATFGSSRAAILTNLHNRNFSVTTVPVSNYPYSIRLADLNGDGVLDMITNDGNNPFVRVYLGTGPGTFGPATAYSPQQYVYALEVGDFNGDSLPDVATVGNLGTTILLGNGAGLLGSRMMLAGPLLYSLAVADMDNDLRADLVSGSYDLAGVQTMLNRCAPQRDRPPHVLAPRSASTQEGAVVTINVTASDPDGEPITQLRADASGLPLGNDAALVPNGANTGGVFTWTPTSADARPAPYPVVFIASNAISGSTTTNVTVTNVNRAPSANAGGPYNALADVAIQFQGGASSDPDGDALTYSWVFGDGTSGKGPAPMHTYHATGTYAVGLVVSDGALTGVATTTVSVLGVFPARAFTLSGNKTIRLNSGKPKWCVEIEPSNTSFLLQVVDLSSIRMKSQGTGSVSEISAIADKSSIGADRDGNGITEFEACFAKTDLRQLFSKVHGSAAVTVTIEGSLLTGGSFRASMDVGVQASGGGNLATSLSPNPLNPSGILTLRLERSGPLRVAIYDVTGRLVRVVCDESMATAGYHDFVIDGRGSHGETLSSGVYFYRVEAAEGVDRGRFTILK
ncbi:MAG TPA: FG-GAP-like repeat-containing protein [Candidatus Eisenbacteria bacterium]|nr:FG-GAP-like repeat-containing protein [Candidatus Eisenbacteria bacterium]